MVGKLSKKGALLKLRLQHQDPGQNPELPLQWAGTLLMRSRQASQTRARWGHLLF